MGSESLEECFQTGANPSRFDNFCRTLRNTKTTPLSESCGSVAWLDAIKGGKTITDVAAEVGVSPAFVRVRLSLAFLSPGIVAAILAGTQPADLTLERLVREKIPLNWLEQEQRFGFTSNSQT